jgi:NAD(P)-dependent dehydrogenase (short-subunit alcohol dehydrogenase family)
MSPTNEAHHTPSMTLGPPDNQAVARQPVARPHSHPLPPAVAGQQPLSGLFQALAIALAALGWRGWRSGRPGRLPAVADGIAYLVHASLITGTILPVDGGLTIA